MTFDQIPTGTDVFLDANVLIYHFVGEPTHGLLHLASHDSDFDYDLWTERYSLA
jgi:hypothetical protein